MTGAHIPYADHCDPDFTHPVPSRFRQSLQAFPTMKAALASVGKAFDKRRTKFGKAFDKRRANVGLLCWEIFVGSLLFFAVGANYPEIFYPIFRIFAPNVILIIRHAFPDVNPFFCKKARFAVLRCRFA
jgi:hypothetical protein